MKKAPPPPGGNGVLHGGGPVGGLAEGGRAEHLHACEQDTARHREPDRNLDEGENT